MKRRLRLLGLSSVVVGAIWLIRARGGDWLRGFVTHRFNPVVMRFGLAGGPRSPWGVVEHVGRTSRTTYRTPIYARIAGDYAFVRLSYGRDVHWVRNVQAAGHCRIQVHDTILELDEPAIVPASDNPMVPASMRKFLDRVGRTYLRLHVLDRAAGSFTRGILAMEVVPAAPLVAELEIVHPVHEGPRESVGF